MVTQRAARKALQEKDTRLDAAVVGNKESPSRTQLARMGGRLSALVDRLDQLDINLYRKRLEFLDNPDVNAFRRIDAALIELWDARLDGLEAHLARIEVQFAEILKKEN